MKTFIVALFLLLLAGTAQAVDRTLSWQDNSTTETGFQIQNCPGSCTNASIWATIGSTAANITTFKVLAVAPNTTTSYRVLAFNLAGVSAPSNIAVDVIPALPSGPTTVAIAPCSSITATADASGSVWTITCVP